MIIKEKMHWQGTGYAGFGHTIELNVIEMNGLRMLIYRYIILSFVLFLLFILAFLFQGSRGIWQPDEGYYTGTAVTMIKKDTVMIPYLGEEEIFLDKPPMIYWGIIAGLKLFGHTEFAVRFFHGLSFLLTSLMTGIIGLELFKSNKIAILSVIIYATMVLPFIAGNFVTPDTILVLWTTATIYCFLRSNRNDHQNPVWQILMCVCIGLGFLAKGPAVLIPCGGIFIFLLVSGNIVKYFKTPWMVAGMLIFVIVGLSWYIWISIKLPGAFTYMFDSQIWGRIVSEKFKRNPGLAGALIYLPVLVFGSMPWSLIWIEKRSIISRTFFAHNSWRILSGKPDILFLVCWFFVPLFVLCLASSKLGFYVLPIFPAIAIATARLWSSKISELGKLECNRIAVFVKPSIMFSLWIVLLVLSKLGLAYYSTSQNMKMLSHQLQGYLPDTNYEVATIDERADGLLFYGIREVEHITDEDDPYPTYSRIEYLLEEINDMESEKEVGLFLVREEDEIIEASKILNNSGIDFSIAYLPSQRALLTVHKTLF